MGVKEEKRRIGAGHLWVREMGRPELGVRIPEWKQSLLQDLGAPLPKGEEEPGGVHEHEGLGTEKNFRVKKGDQKQETEKGRQVFHREKGGWVFGDFHGPISLLKKTKTG